MKENYTKQPRLIEDSPEIIKSIDKYKAKIEKRIKNIISARKTIANLEKEWGVQTEDWLRRGGSKPEPKPEPELKTEEEEYLYDEFNWYEEEEEEAIKLYNQCKLYIKEKSDMLSTAYKSNNEKKEIILGILNRKDIAFEFEDNYKDYYEQLYKIVEFNIEIQKLKKTKRNIEAQILRVRDFERENKIDNSISYYERIRDRQIEQLDKNVSVPNDKRIIRFIQRELDEKIKEGYL